MEKKEALPLWRDRRLWKSLIITAVVSFAVAAPLLLYFASNPQDFLGRTSQVSVFSTEQPLKDISLNTLKTFGMFFVAGDYNWRHNISGKPQLFWPVAVFFLAGIAAGIREAWRARGSFSAMLSTPFSILFFWFLLAMLPVVISNEGIPHALRAILMIPPVMALAGLGAYHIHAFVKDRIARHLPAPEVQRRIYAVGILLIFSLFTLEAYVNYFGVWARNEHTFRAFNGNYVALGTYLDSLPAEIPKYVVVNAPGVSVRGIPMPSQTVMFITDTFRPEEQRTKNLRYVLPEEQDAIPPGSLVISLEP